MTTLLLPAKIIHCFWWQLSVETWNKCWVNEQCNTICICACMWIHHSLFCLIPTSSKPTMVTIGAGRGPLRVCVCVPVCPRQLKWSDWSLHLSSPGATGCKITCQCKKNVWSVSRKTKRVAVRRQRGGEKRNKNSAERCERNGESRRCRKGSGKPLPPALSLLQWRAGFWALWQMCEAPLERARGLFCSIRILMR